MGVEGSASHGAGLARFLWSRSLKVVERRFAWASRFRRPVKDYERLPKLVAGLHFVAFACLILGRLGLALTAGPPTRSRRFDSHYERRGMAHVLTALEPSSGWRKVEVTERRRGREFAGMMRHLAEEIYPRAEYIRLVCDNLSTHSPAAFYESFAPEVARSLAKRIEEHGQGCYASGSMRSVSSGQIGSER